MEQATPAFLHAENTHRFWRHSPEQHSVLVVQVCPSFEQAAAHAPATQLPVLQQSAGDVQGSPIEPEPARQAMKMRLGMQSVPEQLPQHGEPLQDAHAVHLLVVHKFPAWH